MEQFKNIKDNSGFKVPENYFNEFPKKIEEIIANVKPDKPKKLQLKAYYSIAAVFVSIIVVATVLIKNYTKEPTQLENQTLAYLECNIYDVSDEILYDVTIESESLETKTNNNIELDVLAEEITEEEIIYNYNN
jgi:hypothetical protein